MWISRLDKTLVAPHAALVFKLPNLVNDYYLIEKWNAKPGSEPCMRQGWLNERTTRTYCLAGQEPFLPITS